MRLLPLLGWLPLAALLLSGCSTPALKGTPYYSTETDQDAVSAKERIPLWPLLYYRSPTLSVLWPLFEKSDEYMALRPLASVSGLDEPRQIYSLLWPLGQFNRVAAENRFFPFFWGDGYAVGFPLYWHFGHPLGPEGGLDALIPLWWYSTHKQGYSFNFLWPLINVKDEPPAKGWRAWPLAGAYRGGTAGDYYRFAAWPLAHQWSSGRDGETGEAVLPLYVRRRQQDGHSFYSLLYSRHRDARSGWDLLLPLLYRSRTPEGSKTITPLFFQGSSANSRSAWQLLLPLYYSSRNEDRRTLVTLLGGMNRDKNGTGWAVLPLLAGGIRRTDGTGLFLSVPWSGGTRRDGSRWSLVPPVMLKLAHGRDRSIYTPLYSAGTRDDGARTWQTLVPLWYRSEGAGEKTVATLAGGWQTGADGRRWMIWPLLSGGHRGADRRDLWVVAPLFHARWDQAGLSHHLLPLYWWEARDKRLISPIVSTWGSRERGSRTTVVPPALTLYSSGPKRKDLWAVAGAAHLSWGEEAGSSHVLPFYYRDPASDTFLSLPWSTWTWNRSSTNTVIPPALSWITRREGRSDLWAVGPLAHVSWGEKAGASHVFPLYYRNRQDDTFISLPYAHWKDGEAERTLYPPLLSMFSREGDERRLDALLGLFSERWGGDRHDGYFLPFYYYETGTSFYTPLFGLNRDPQSGFFYPLTPLLGIRTGEESGGWLFPFWSRRHDKVRNATTGTILWGSYSRNEQGSEAAVYPLFGYRNRKAAPGKAPPNLMGVTQGKTFWSLPAVWYRNTVDITPVRNEDGRPTGQLETSTARDHGFFPLWSHTHLKTPLGGDETFGSLLLVLYDYKTTIKPAATPATEPRNYARRRLLWRFWHYERKDDTVSVDVFPAMTYDRGAEGYRRWAFLWRAFRYETGPEGKNMDLLFIPVMRRHQGG
jgi:hypothetical protein